MGADDNRFSRSKRFNMGKAGKEIAGAISAMGASSAEAAKNLRASQVKAMWRDLMESNGDDAILDHTNAVYIIRRTVEDYENSRGRLPHTPQNAIDDRKDASATGVGKQLIVYVDDSMVASELNARRELIKMQFAARYREVLDEFKIFISRGQYKNNHPFKSRPKPSYESKVESVPLTPEELAWVHDQVQVIQDPRLRANFEKAMIADMEWRRGEAKADAQAKGVNGE